MRAAGLWGSRSWPELVTCGDRVPSDEHDHGCAATPKAIHRGSFASVPDLTRRIRAFIDGWNQRCHPSVWTKTAEDILQSLSEYMAKISGAGH